jgi:hypothetical protein
VVSRPKFTGRFAALVDRAGGVSAFARAIGVNESTIWRWSTGKVAPSHFAKDAVNQWAARHGLASPWGTP